MVVRLGAHGLHVDEGDHLVVCTPNQILTAVEDVELQYQGGNQQQSKQVKKVLILRASGYFAVSSCTAGLPWLSL